MRHLDLCSGIGGFALAARWAGWETVQFVEIDKFCQKVLAKNFPGVPVHDDLKTFSGEPFRGGIDILTAGYPCQPFSTAGKRFGVNDPRHLWPEVLRVIRECRPRWCVLENVAGHISMGLDAVLSDLEIEGYAVQAGVIPACATGAYHRRDRVWIIAHNLSSGTRVGELNSGRQERESTELLERTMVRPENRETPAKGHYPSCPDATDATSRRRGGWPPQTCGDIHGICEDEQRGDNEVRRESVGHGEDATYSECLRELQPQGSESDKWGRLSDSCENAADSDSTRLQGREDAGSDGGYGQEPDDEYARRCTGASSSYPSSAGLPDWAGGTVGQPSPLTEFERPDGAGKAREIERDFRGVPHGVSRRVDRLRALGNAIVPQVAYEIFKAIKAQYREEVHA